jgi:Tol biopolymer transport system component
MAPEQARGRAVDKRADIWAFGVVLYEMLTGTRLFQGEDVSVTLAAVLTREPDMGALPAGTPQALRRLLERCLTRDPRLRLRDIGDARFDLAEAEGGPSQASPAAPPPRQSRALGAALALVAASSIAVAVWVLVTARAPQPQPSTHLSMPLPPGRDIESGPAITRDGRRLAFVSAESVGPPQLYVRALGDADARLLPGTDEASAPFFSPDGQWIAFYARNELFKVSVEGGAPVRLATSNGNAGGTWADDGTIIFKKAFNGELFRVGENGGDVTSFLPLGPDDYSYAWPFAIPGRDEMLLAAWGKSFDLRLLDAKAMTARAIAQGQWRKAVYVPPGYVVYAGDGELDAMPLPDAGEAPTSGVAMVGNVVVSRRGDAQFDVSQTGTLAYVRSEHGRRSLAIVDQRGQATGVPVPVPEGQYDQVRVSPDGRYAAVGADLRLSIVDLQRGTMTPVVPELSTQVAAQAYPVWSPDGRHLTFASNHEGNFDLYSKAASGAGDLVTVLERPLAQYPDSYAPDGTLLFETTAPDTGTDLWMLPPGGEAHAWLATPAEEWQSAFSPDGRVVAYSSNASGRFEVYVQARNDAGDRIQVSVSGGNSPIWSPKGDRLYFQQGNAVMEATIRTADRLSSSTPVQLFDGGWTRPRYFPFGVLPDGRFLMIQQARDSIPTGIDVVLNWLPALEARLRQ